MRAEPPLSACLLRARVIDVVVDLTYVGAKGAKGFHAAWTTPIGDQPLAPALLMALYLKE